LVRLDRFYPPHDGVALCAKLEYLNPGGSVKDRIGLEMIADAEARGTLQPGGAVIEPTAGNTGIGLALVAAVRGYRCICVIPAGFSQGKQMLLRAMGAEVVNTPTDQGMAAAIAKAHELAARTPGSVVLQQFANPANVAAHYKTTGPEIWRQMDGQVDVVVLGAGSGGTFTGVTRYLQERNPGLCAVIVQPYGSSLGQGYRGRHKVEGIGVDNPAQTPILDQTLIDHMIVVRDEDAQTALKQLASTEGILVGGSAGAAAHAARLVADEIVAGRLAVGGGNVVTLFPDGLERYMSQHILGTFDEWTV
jgi:O-acetylserine dependent cystathionine beta-synthase